MNDSIKIVIGGDLFPTPVNFQQFSEGIAESVFDEKIVGIFDQADYSVCNLEGAFTAESTAPKLKYGPNIRAPQSCIKGYTALGVDCVSLANNHATDYGRQGLSDTFLTLDDAGIGHFGAGMTSSEVSTHYQVTIKGERFIFYGVSETLENEPTDSEPGVNLYDEYRVCREIAALKAKCDHLIVLYHGGIENTHYNTSSIRRRFQRMAECGADIITSQHTHAVGEEEYYKGAYLLYGQGNFCFHYSKRNDEWIKHGLLLEIEFSPGGFTVKKHPVRREDPMVVYDDGQALSGFDERSRLMGGGDTFAAEFKRYADQKLPNYLHAFRGNNLIDKIAHKFMSREKYLKYLRRQYSREQLLMILLALQSEEFREVSTRGFMNLLEETDTDLK